MRFLEKNTRLVSIAALLPIFVFYLDDMFISWVRSIEYAHPYVFQLLESVDPLFSFLSNGKTISVGIILLLVGGSVFYNGAYELSKSLCLGFLSAGIVAQVLKHLIGRARPRLTHDLVLIGPSFRGGYDSFPSGHTTVAFCLACILSARFPKGRVIFYSAAAVMGFERAEDLYHFLSDVLGGAVIGIMVGGILLKRGDRPH